MKINSKNRLNASKKITASSKEANLLLNAAKEDIEYLYGTFSTIKELKGQNAAEKAVVEALEDEGVLSILVDYYTSNPDKYGDPVNSENDYNDMIVEIFDKGRYEYIMNLFDLIDSTSADDALRKAFISQVKNR